MIKINLGLNKEFGSSKVSASRILIFVGKLVGTVALCYGITLGYTYMLKKQSEPLNQQAQELIKKKQQYDAEAAQHSAAGSSGSGSDSAHLDQALQGLQSQLSQLQALYQQNQLVPQKFLALAQDVPHSLWLTEYSESERDFTLQGSTYEVDQISDFMSRLSETPSFHNVSLKESKTASQYKTIFILQGSKN